MCAIRVFRIWPANIGPNRFHQNRTVSWLMSIPRSARRSSTLRNDSGYFTYIITTRRITSGELLKYRNGSFIPQNTSARRNQEIALTEPSFEFRSGTNQSGHVRLSFRDRNNGGAVGAGNHPSSSFDPRDGSPLDAVHHRKIR